MERMVCWECLTVAIGHARGWRAYRADQPGEDPEPILLFYCPDCAQREFGPFPPASDTAPDSRR